MHDAVRVKTMFLSNLAGGSAHTLHEQRQFEEDLLQQRLLEKDLALQLIASGRNHV